MSSAPDLEVNRPHSVYVCYDTDDTVLYVGCAEDVEHRMFHLTHLCNAGKQPNGTLRRHMVRHSARVFSTKAIARAAERRMIAALAPLLNKQHNPTRFTKVKGGTYALVEPVHPVTRAAYPELPTVERRAAA